MSEKEDADNAAVFFVVVIFLLLFAAMTQQNKLEAELCHRGAETYCEE